MYFHLGNLSSDDNCLDKQKFLLQYKPIFYSNSCIFTCFCFHFHKTVCLNVFYCQRESYGWYTCIQSVLDKLRTFLVKRPFVTIGAIFDTTVFFCNQLITNPQRNTISQVATHFCYQLFSVKYTQISNYALTALVYYKGLY